jgi:hypothetical protein
MHLYGQWQPGLRYNTLEHLFAKHDTYPSLYDGGIRRTVRRHGWYNGQTSDGYNGQTSDGYNGQTSDGYNGQTSDGKWAGSQLTVSTTKLPSAA